MKKIMLIFLFVTGTVIDLSAQWTNSPYYYLYPSSATAGESLFDRPQPGKAKANFHFLNAFKNGRITLELVSIKQLNHLPDLDSILSVAKSSLMFLADSLKQDGISRRLDLFITDIVQARIINHTERPSTFVIKQNELNTLKVDMDTLRIKFYAKTGIKQNIQTEKGMQNLDQVYPAFITIIMNNFDDLSKLPNGIMKTCFDMIRKDLNEEYVGKQKGVNSYSAYYNLTSNKRFSPQNSKWIKDGRLRNELVPNFYTSIQYAKGVFSPSIAFGARYTIPRSAERSIILYWMTEKYYFFSRDIDNKIRTDDNTFTTFRYIEQNESEKKKNGFNFIMNASLGYLIKRRGDWFDKSTFKIGLPGVRSGWLQVEPEFYFHNFLRNVSPTLKLTLHYE